MPEEEGKLVGTGGFRVAGARALEVLRAAQLDRKFWRPLLWLRLAAALGARRVDVTAGPRSVTMTLDGRPISRALLSNPLSLFADGAAPPESRWLAYALVHTLWEGVTVNISSGIGRDRRASKFDVTGYGKAVLPGPGDGTSVQVAWSPLLTTMLDKARPWAWFPKDPTNSLPRLQMADAVPFALTTPLGSVTPWERRKEPEAAVLRGYGRRVRVRMAEGGSSLTLHHYGVRVHGRELDDLAIPMAVDVDEPNLALDASLNAPVQGPELERAVAGGLAAAHRHGKLRLERHAKAMRLSARLLLARPELRRLWALALSAPERLDRRVPWLMRAAGLLRGRLKPSGDALRVVRAAEFTAFLRAAALKSLRGRKIDARDSLRDALWGTPLLFSATGRPLSLAELDLDERPCSVWGEPEPAPAGAGAMMAWGLCAADTAFVTAFPKRRARMG